MNDVNIKPCPCKDCTKHSAYCHNDTCKDWVEWHQWQQERKERIAKDRKLNHALDGIGLRKTKSRRRAAKMLRDQNHQQQNGGK